MGLFSLCKENTKEALIKNIQANLKLLEQNHDLEYLVSFVQTDLDQLKKLYKEEKK